MTKTNEYIIPWDDSLNTGIPWIDEQHKQMLKHIETMLNALMKKKCSNTINHLILFLNEYVHSHFNAEQNFMLRYNYPNYLIHTMQHKEFFNKFKQMEEKYAQQGASRDLALEIEKELWEWYKTHICKMDKNFSTFLQKRKSKKDSANDIDLNTVDQNEQSKGATGL